MSKRFGVRLYKQYFNFASAHFLIFEDGRREFLHGHNYQMRVNIDGALGAGDVVLDFTVVKPMIKALCDAVDHKVMLPEKASALSIRETDNELEVRMTDGKRFVFPREDVVLLPLTNTSTERLSEYFAERLLSLLQAQFERLDIDSLRVEVEESGGQCGWCERTVDGRPA